MGIEESEADAVHLCQHVRDLAQTGYLVARQVHLGHVTGNHGCGTKADSGEKHFHLFLGGVLGFIQNHESLVQGATAHIGQGGYFDNIPLHQFVYLFEAQHFIQRIVQGAQIGVDFLGQVAGQEAQALACFHRRTYQQYPAYQVTLECVYCTGHRQIGFSCTSRPHAEIDVVGHYPVHVLMLVGAAGSYQAALGFYHHVRQGLQGLIDRQFLGAG